MTPSQVQQLLAHWSGKGYTPNPNLRYASPKPQMPNTDLATSFWNAPDMQGSGEVLPKATKVTDSSFNPAALQKAGQDLAGGFWNAPAGQTQVQAPAPVPPNNGFDFAKIIEALNAPRGHHLGIGGAEMTQANPMGNFGGDPFTNGFFKPNPQSDYRPGAEYHMPTMPQQQPFMPFQGAQAPTPGSPIYRQQNPNDPNNPENILKRMGGGQNSGNRPPFSFGLLPRR